MTTCEKFLTIFLQPSLPNGKNGASGPNVQPRVDLDPKSGPVLAVTQHLEAMINVTEIRQWLNLASYPSVKV